MGIRISEMEEATTFGADDYVPIVTNGTNKKALGSKIKDFIAGFFATKTGDNISDKATFRSAIEISATNTPFDKTGTGMSAENVQAAIAELSGNRALIDGSNIANPSAFRSAISALYDIYLQAFVAPTSGTDLNTLVSNAISIYQIGNIAQYGNAPSGKGSTGLLIVFKVNTYVIQLWLSNTTISHRASYNSGGTWANWL